MILIYEMYTSFMCEEFVLGWILIQDAEKKINYS